MGGDKCGAMKPIWFRSIDKSTDAQNAYVVCASPEGANKVSLVANGYQADATHVLRADGVGKRAKLQNFDPKRSVFLGNLAANVTEADFRTAFESVGVVDAVRIVRDKYTKECKGFAFV